MPWYTREQARRVDLHFRYTAPTGTNIDWYNRDGDSVYFYHGSPPAQVPAKPARRPEPKANEFNNPRRQARPR